MSFDLFVVVGIVIGAAFYLYRKFAAKSTTGCGGCSSGGTCCGGEKHKTDA